MKLIILYGAPAAGKFTIAQKMAEDADIKVLHNHEVIDVFSSLVSREYSDFTPTIRKLTLTILKAAVKADQGNIVVTVAYAANYPGDKEYVANIVSTARENGAEVFPFFLKCDNKVLLERAEAPSRKAYGKITTKDVMSHVIDNFDLATPVDVKGNRVIDTTDLSAEAVANKIKELTGL